MDDTFLIVLSFLTSTTMSAHHEMSVSTLDMIPSDSMYFSSFCIFWWSGSVTIGFKIFLNIQGQKNI